MLAIRPLLFTILLFGASNAMAEPLELNCRIEPHVRVEVSSSAEGVVSEILVKKNQIIKKGDVIARLESKLESATAELRRLQADLESDVDAQVLALQFAGRNLKRVKNLYDKKAASFAELDKAKTEHELAEQQLQQAKDRKQQADLEYKRSMADLERKTIRSPISGIVTERYKEAGEHIYFEPIVQIVQLDPLRIEAFAPASFFGRIQEEAMAVVMPELAIGKSSYSARVETVDKVIDAPSNTFGVVLTLPNADMVLPSGLKCRVRFSAIENQSTLLDH